MTPVCAWGMEAKTTRPGVNRFGERCCNAIFQGQILCAQNGCNAKVHQWCQWAWVNKARLPVDYSSPV